MLLYTTKYEVKNDYVIFRISSMSIHCPLRFSLCNLIACFQVRGGGGRSLTGSDSITLFTSGCWALLWLHCPTWSKILESSGFGYKVKRLTKTATQVLTVVLQLLLVYVTDVLTAVLQLLVSVTDILTVVLQLLLVPVTDVLTVVLLLLVSVTHILTVVLQLLIVSITHVLTVVLQLLVSVTHVLTAVLQLLLVSITDVLTLVLQLIVVSVTHVMTVVLWPIYDALTAVQLQLSLTSLHKWSQY